MRAVEVIDGKLKCSRCGIIKPVSEFSKGRNKSGYRSNCKQCVHELYLADKERILAQHKEYYENNKEKYLENCKDYRESHKEERKEYFKDYYINHSDELRKRSSIRYRNSTPEQLAKRKAYAKSKVGTEEYRAYKRMKFHYRKALMKKLPNDFTNKEWKAVVATFDNRCAYCGEEKPLTQDHIIPVNKGGGYTKKNIVPCCGSCNSSKQDRDFITWFEGMPFFSEERLKKIYAVMEG